VHAARLRSRGRADLVAPVRLKFDATDLARMVGRTGYRITHTYAGILAAPAKLPGNLAWPRRGLSSTG
jgi:hypothetical protein